MLICEGCGKHWGMEHPVSGMMSSRAQGEGWWQLGKQLVDERMVPMPFLSYRRDFCSEACIRAYYSRPVEGAPTQRLPALAKVQP